MAGLQDAGGIAGAASKPLKPNRALGAHGQCVSDKPWTRLLGRPRKITAIIRLQMMKSRPTLRRTATPTRSLLHHFTIRVPGQKMLPRNSTLLRLAEILEISRVRATDPTAGGFLAHSLDCDDAITRTALPPSSDMNLHRLMKWC